jgi:hypothetical protein
MMGGVAVDVSGLFSTMPLSTGAGAASSVPGVLVLHAACPKPNRRERAIDPAHLDAEIILGSFTVLIA